MSDDGTSELDAARERLHGVYAAEGSQSDLAEYYARWADDYDRHVGLLGYQVPAMVAAMAARHVARASGPILDCAAGTGIVGGLLRALGYPELIAIDLSEEMLAVARARGSYRELHRMVLGERLAFPDRRFAACVAAGVFTAGHAPPDSFAELARITRAGGHVIWGERADGDHSAGYRAAAELLQERGVWTLEEASEPYQTFRLSSEDAHVLNRVFVYRVA